MLKEPVHTHDWTDPRFLKGLSDDDLFAITKQGASRSAKSKVMLAYGHKMSDDEIRRSSSSSGASARLTP